MSPVRLNGSTSGYSELSAPAVAGNNSIALPTGNGSAYQVLRNGATAGSLEYADKLVSGTAQASTSGTSIDFTSIPSWVKRVTVMFSGVSTSGSSDYLFKLGYSAGVVSSGYLSTSNLLSTGTNSVAYTSGFGINQSGVGTAATFHGNVIFTLLNSATNLWSASGTLAMSDAARTAITAGSVTISGTLDRVRITTVNGTDTFDAGSINIAYEG